jgi:WD40 repeat protein
MTDNLVACGTFRKQVLLFDPRENSYKPLTSYTVHKKCVLALGMDDTRIISCSEDGKTILYDIRAQKAVKTISLSNGAYPTCLSFRREAPAPLFYIGDRSGQIHLVNSDLFEIVQTYDIGHKQIVQGVFHSLGSVMTCSKDGHMKVMEPSLGLQELASLKIDAELPGVHSFNNTVALAGGDSVVRLWAPKEGF